ncbi:acyl-CoA/acyl-ACP dehydrogenase [Thermoplasmatales archaeon AK]|nr:acyl-CoA/acyl-ACP dehydrogenase [Thermoplasmatales archaeon AK]
MDFNFTDEQNIIRDTAREFSERYIEPSVQEMIKTHRIPAELINAMAKQGFLGMTVPEEYGGMGASAVTTGIVAEEIARCDTTASVSVLFLVDNAWSYLVSRYASQELKDEILPRIAKGEILTGIASTEPNYGSDIGSMTTTAVERGGSYYISGEKSYISLVRDIRERGGGYVTVAKTDLKRGTSGVTLFYVPDSSNIEISDLEEMGREGSTWGALKFEEVKVPSHNIIGQLNGGFRIVHEGFEFARGLIAVICASAAERAIARSVEYMKTRKAFGREIGKFEGLQFTLAEDVARMEAAKTLGYKALWMYDEEHKSGRFTRFQVTDEIAMAKLLSTTWAFDAINNAMQVHGAYGYLKNNPLELSLRAIRSFQLAEGSREVMKLIIARETLGREFFRGD